MKFHISGKKKFKLVFRIELFLSNERMFFRFNPQLSEDVPMDEKSDQKLINMMWEAKAYIYANRNKVIEMINLLK